MSWSKYVDCGREISGECSLYCNIYGDSTCEECETTGPFSTCAEIHESEIALEDMEAEEDE